MATKPQALAILDAIRANASNEYQTMIPEATRENFTAIGNALENYEPLFNEFYTSLIHKIGKTIVQNKLFNNKLARFKSGSLSNPQDVEEIFVDMADAAKPYDPDGKTTLMRRTYDNVKVIYHRQNRQDYYALSIGDLDVKRAFKSPEAFSAFIGAKFNSVYNRAEYDEWNHMKNLIATYNGYAYQQVPTINGDAENTISFIKHIRKTALDMTYYTDKFNAAGVRTNSTPEGMTLFINKDILTEVDVDVLSKAYNMGKTDIQLNIMHMDDFGSLTDTYAILADNDWFKCWDTLNKMENQRNGEGLFTNHFLHIHQILSLSKFKQAVRFGTAAVSG